MKAYIMTFFAYLFTYQLVKAITGSDMIALAAEAAVVLCLLIYFRNSYSIKPRIDYLAILIGAAVFALWVLIDLIPYPRIQAEPYIPGSIIQLLLRLFIMILIAPIVEEFFTRYFLIRFAISEKWDRIKIGTFTWGSFIFTTLFFGFAHDMWLAGLMAGVAFNLLYYYRKNVESCITAHIVANVFLAIYILVTQNWHFW
jgi:CAAX prenyl protease-like protein